MSLPDDETREPQHNPDPVENDDAAPEEPLAFGSDSDTELSDAFVEDAEFGEGADPVAGNADDDAAFMADDLAGETVDQPPGEDSIAGGEEDQEPEKGEGGEDQDEKEGVAARLQRVLAVVATTDPYTVLLGIALFALLLGVLFFYLELSAYNFDIGAERARQLVGALGLPRLW